MAAAAVAVESTDWLILPASRELLSRADARCVSCRGVGGWWGKREWTTCGCVWRAIFQSVLRQYWRYRLSGRRRGLEFCIDVDVAARSLLDATELRVYEMYWVGGANYREVGAALRLDRGTLFHVAYRVAARLGRHVYEARPYALYPVREYLRPWRESKRAEAE